MELTLICWCFLIIWGICSANHCDHSDDTCEFWLSIKFVIPMMKDGKALYPKDGKLYQYDVINTTSATPVSPDGVLTADGHESSRAVVTANGTMPGPSIEVYYGQNVIIHVKNDLFSDGVTIHWHGLHQRGTPHMDGVAYVTQCPIMPGQTFTYKFKADPIGTFWYHSHIGFQRTEGLLGAFIIRENNKALENEKLVVLQDWNHQYDADTIQLKMTYDQRHKTDGPPLLDGAMFSRFDFQSGLINGRGRFHSDKDNHNEAPLHVFDLDAGKEYRFRVISAGLLFPYRLSVHGHMLTVVASDGYELESITVDSIIINPGERFDFILRTSAAVSNYWMFSESLEPFLNHVAEAVIRYSGAPIEEPTSTPRPCTPSQRCKVLNCPFSYYPVGSYTDCITFNELRSKTTERVPMWEAGNSKEIFLNFGFPGITQFPSSINGRSFIMPPVASLTQPAEITPRCEDADCGVERNCFCASSIDIDNNDTVQMVLLNMGNDKGPPGLSHPIHLHGHSFYVLKMGYARYNETTGEIIGDNLDIDCRGNPDREKSFCNSATWSDASWADGNISDLELERPPRKDTLIVPFSGYAIVRIKADNPGVWFMHCHVQLHGGDGMATMINESFSEVPPAPKGFPVCGNFPPQDSTNFPRDSANSIQAVWYQFLTIVVVFGAIETFTQ